MLRRTLKKGFSKIYGLRTISKLHHMSKAKEYKSEFLKNPQETSNFVKYLEELNKAGQKPLVKSEMDKYRNRLLRLSIRDYSIAQSQYDIAEKGRDVNLSLKRKNRLGTNSL